MPMSARTMSGGAASSRSMAWSPSLTATTLISSSANVSSMTRWMVTLSSARRRVFGTLVLSDEGTQVIRCFGTEVLSSIDNTAAGEQGGMTAHLKGLSAYTRALAW